MSSGFFGPEGFGSSPFDDFLARISGSGGGPQRPGHRVDITRLMSQPARDLLCVLLLRHNDLVEVVTQAEEAKKLDPYDEVAIYQELLAQRKLKNNDAIEPLVKQLQEAKAHNQEAKTKYILEEAQPAAPQ